MGNPVGESEARPPTGRERYRRVAARIGYLTICFAAIPSITGFAGRAWWIFELASHFRAQYFWGLLGGMVFLVLARRWRGALVGGVLLVAHAWLLAELALPSVVDSRGGTSLRVMTLNVWARNHEIARVIDFVRRASPDIVVLEEIDSRWEEPLSSLKSEWPYGTQIAEGGHHGIALLSRAVLDESRVALFTDGIPLVYARATVGEIPVTILGIHLDRPTSRIGANGQVRQCAELADLLNETTGEKIVLGDFNATSWSAAFNALVSTTGLRDTRPGFGIQPTWPSYLPEGLRIPIDHCLVSPRIVATRRQAGPNVGSDHLPVIVDLEIAPP
jgi:endonuclease/exonuclease/phosphatase (EEP) superfamily protein YafD